MWPISIVLLAIITIAITTDMIHSNYSQLYRNNDPIGETKNRAKIVGTNGKHLANSTVSLYLNNQNARFAAQTSYQSSVNRPKNGSRLNQTIIHKRNSFTTNQLIGGRNCSCTDCNNCIKCPQCMSINTMNPKTNNNIAISQQYGANPLNNCPTTVYQCASGYINVVYLDRSQKKINHNEQNVTLYCDMWHVDKTYMPIWTKTKWHEYGSGKAVVLVYCSSVNTTAGQFIQQTSTPTVSTTPLDAINISFSDTTSTLSTPNPCPACANLVAMKLNASYVMPTERIGINPSNQCPSKLLNCEINQTIGITYMSGTQEIRSIQHTRKDRMTIYCANDGSWHTSCTGAAVQSIYCIDQGIALMTTNLSLEIVDATSFASITVSFPETISTLLSSYQPVSPSNSAATEQPATDTASISDTSSMMFSKQNIPSSLSLTTTNSQPVSGTVSILNISTLLIPIGIASITTNQPTSAESTLNTTLLYPCPICANLAITVLNASYVTPIERTGINPTNQCTSKIFNCGINQMIGVTFMNGMHEMLPIQHSQKNAITIYCTNDGLWHTSDTGAAVKSIYCNIQAILQTTATITSSFKSQFVTTTLSSRGTKSNTVKNTTTLPTICPKCIPFIIVNPSQHNYSATIEQRGINPSNNCPSRIFYCEIKNFIIVIYSDRSKTVRKINYNLKDAITIYCENDKKWHASDTNKIVTSIYCATSSEASKQTQKTNKITQLTTKNTRASTFTGKVEATLTTTIKPMQPTSCPVCGSLMMTQPMPTSGTLPSITFGINTANHCRSIVYNCNIGSMMMIYYTDSSKLSINNNVATLYCNKVRQWYDSKNNKVVDSIYCVPTTMNTTKLLLKQTRSTTGLMKIRVGSTLSTKVAAQTITTWSTLNPCPSCTNLLMTTLNGSYVAPIQITGINPSNQCPSKMINCEVNQTMGVIYMNGTRQIWTIQHTRKDSITIFCANDGSWYASCTGTAIKSIFCIIQKTTTITTSTLSKCSTCSSLTMSVLKPSSAINPTISNGIDATNNCQWKVYECSMNSTILIYYIDKSQKNITVKCQYNDVVTLFCQNNGIMIDSKTGKAVDSIYCTSVSSSSVRQLPIINNPINSAHISVNLGSKQTAKSNTVSLATVTVGSKGKSSVLANVVNPSHTVKLDLQPNAKPPISSKTTVVLKGKPASTKAKSIH